MKQQSKQSTQTGNVQPAYLPEPADLKRRNVIADAFKKYVIKLSGKEYN